MWVYSGFGDVWHFPGGGLVWLIIRMLHLKASLENHVAGILHGALQRVIDSDCGLAFIIHL